MGTTSRGLLIASGLLAIVWFVLLLGTFVSFYYAHGNTGLKPLHSSYSDTGIPGYLKHIPVAVYDQPNGQKLSELRSRWSIGFRLNTQSPDWLELTRPLIVFDPKSRSGHRGVGTWVKRDDITFTPPRLLASSTTPEGDIVQYMPGSARCVVARIWPFPTPHDEHNELEEIFSGLLLFSADTDQPLIYAAVSCTEFSFTARKLSNGTYAFGNDALFWQLRPYCWRHGKYQQSFAYLPQEFNPQLKRYLATAFSRFAFLAMLSGLIPCIFILLALRPGIVAVNATPPQLRLHAHWLAAILLVLALFDAVCISHGYHPEMSYCVAATVPLLFVCITHLAIIQVRLHSASTQVREKTDSKGGDGMGSDL